MTRCKAVGHDGVHGDKGWKQVGLGLGWDGMEWDAI